MIRGKIGERMLIAQEDSGDSGDSWEHPVEVRLLERTKGVIKVEFLTEGWASIGAIRWLNTEGGKGSWYKVSRLP